MTNTKDIPPQEYLQERFEYKPETGELIWKKRTQELFKTVGAFGMWNTRFAGKPVGTNHPDRNGKIYLRTKIDGSFYRVHRIIWMLVRGENPDQVDHINGNGLDNRLTALRNVTHAENQRNVKLGCNNTSGHYGVHWHVDNARNTARWVAKISDKNQLIHLGYFDDKWDAICARKSAEHKYNYHENHGAQR